MVDITQDKIRIRTMVPGDAAALLKWMTDARVLEFYEGRDKRYTEELIREDFFEENNDSVMKVIVEYDGVPIGYGQIYPMGGED